MTREEKQKAIDALKKSAPVMAVTQEEFNDYIQTLNKIMDWLEQETVSKEDYDHEYFLRKEFEIKIDKLQCQLEEQAVKAEPILDKINKMKSEIADSLEFWDYSPNNNPLARDMLETITNFWGDIKAESEDNK